ncbi:short-chain dehydrogenase/reductase SDR [Serratia sp. FS14]|uniref:SDR family oxidoreductase n=1 Tax=Serratia sp. (strain FS14) TaxID=1327989 RepID=UPI00049984DC|nr:SDR family oxidoreductase [Serratia sp. FS14]AIA48111.1 short-chain dehydrogenase/reductase SDR [Serratia sp. FS14]MBH2948378.1 SDR family oxidoreductase [Serratia marcescens]
MGQISGKVVVITGASSGLGAATAHHLASLGATLVLAARRKERLDALVSECITAGGQALAVTVDVTQHGDVKAMVAETLAQFGRIDVLINNAGLMAIAPINMTKVDEWERMIDINVKGVLYGIAEVLPVFEKQNEGHFINISSVAGVKVFSPGGTVYSGTKFAVRAISEGLRHETGGHIRTTTICPGFVDSELKFGSSDAASLQFLLECYEQAIPASSVARAIAYAIEQPADVDINEIVLRPTQQDF